MNPPTVCPPHRKSPGSGFITFDDRHWGLVRPDSEVCVCLDPILRTAAWNVGELAGLVGMSTRTLCRVIESSTSLSAKTWLRRHRIVTASYLLREDWKIECLSAVLGFQHPSAFTREFKTLVGVTPSVYIRMERSRFFAPPSNGLAVARGAFRG